MHQEPKNEKAAIEAAFSGETWFRNFTSAHRAMFRSSTVASPARLPDPDFTFRITPDADSYYLSFTPQRKHLLLATDLPNHVAGGSAFP
jgi:hypothetical protein